MKHILLNTITNQDGGFTRAVFPMQFVPLFPTKIGPLSKCIMSLCSMNIKEGKAMEQG